jgi:hypothetical protein
MGRVLFLGLVFLLPRLGTACGCVGIASGCDRSWMPKETAFLGRVTAMEKTGESGFLSSYAARFVVDENFGGVAAGSEATVYTGMGGGDCGYPFVPGVSYLVYAGQQNGDGRLHAGICSATAPAVGVGGVLPELRAWRDHRRLDDLFGAVLQAPKGSRFDDLVESKPLAGVKVQAMGAHGQSYAAQTDAMGAFAFHSLPAGTYKVRADLPVGLTLWSSDASADVAGEGSGCALSQSAKSDGRIEGMVVDPLGKPMRGFVTIQPSDPQEAAEARRRGGLPGDDVTADGRFVLPLLPAGRYRLTFHPATARGVDFATTYYWPGNADESIEVGLGQHIAGLRFSVPGR